MKNYINIIAVSGVAFILVLGIISLLNISFPVLVTTTTKSTELSVVGEGKVDVVPDTATVNVGISVNNAPTVQEAQKQIDTTNNAIIAAMKKIGIDSKNIKTGNYSIYPQYDYNNSRAVTGYSGDVQVTIKTHQMAQVSQIIQEATKAGANTINNTDFTVDDPAKYRVEARNKAIANAKEQAQNIAASLGIKLGKVTNIVESTPNDVNNMAFSAKAMGGAGGGGADFETGTQTITSTVTLFFEKR